MRERLDQHVARGRCPGLQYVAIDRAGTRFAHATGWADLGGRRPMEHGTTLMAYSMSKTLTAAAALRLVQDGRLRLDQPAASCLRDFPYGPAITVRQLLDHTSGIPHPVPLRWVHLATAHGSFDERAAREAVVRAHPRLAFRPGTRFAYSNIGYWLLGEVIAAAGGRPFTTIVTEEILAPLGVSPRDLGYRIADPERHGAGYLEKYSLMNLTKGLLIDRAFLGGYEGAWLRIASHYPNGPAFGGLVGNATGFAMFLADALRERSVLFEPATRALLEEPQHLASGRAIPMTLAWHTRSAHGTRVLYKEGGGGGFRHLMRLYPDRGLATVVMTNATGFDVRGCLDETDRLFLG